MDTRKRRPGRHEEGPTLKRSRHMPAVRRTGPGPPFGQFPEEAAAAFDRGSGPTNSKEYLQSQTGNAEVWPLEVLSAIDIEKLKRDRCS